MLNIRVRSAGRSFRWFAYLHASYTHMHAISYIFFHYCCYLNWLVSFYLRNNNNNTFKNEMCCGKLFGFEFYGYFWQSNFHEAFVFGVFGIASLLHFEHLYIFASLGWIQVFLMRHWNQWIWKSHATILANWLRLLNSTQIHIKFTLLVIFSSVWFWVMKWLHGGCKIARIPWEYHRYSNQRVVVLLLGMRTVHTSMHPLSYDSLLQRYF